MRKVLVFLLVWCCCPWQWAQAYTYRYDEHCASAYRAFMALQGDEGRRHIAAALKADPANLMAVYIADYDDCLQLLINSNKDDFEQRAAHFEQRLKQLEKGDEHSPWYRFCKAGLYMHWAIIGVRFGEQVTAGIRFHKSFALLKENQRLYPTFLQNNIFAGLQEAVVGSLPGSYKWLAGVFGLQGSIKSGISKLEAIVNSYDDKFPFYAEADLYYTYVNFYLANRQKEAWARLDAATHSTKGNILGTYIKTSIAIDYRMADAALATLNTSLTSADYPRYPVFYHLAGVAMLHKLDTNCNANFRQFLAHSRSGMYIKDTWLKMALANHAAGNTAAAAYCLEQVGTQGKARLDADKQAERFAERGSWPDVRLLRARLLTEGGQYMPALETLKPINVAALHPADRTEYHYRTGRIHEDMATNGIGKGNYQQAIKYYTQAISEGRTRHEQFAARAALQTGKVLEALGLYADARAKYQECLDMPPHDFQNSIDQQAKAGINRVKEQLPLR